MARHIWHSRLGNVDLRRELVRSAAETTKHARANVCVHVCRALLISYADMRSLVTTHRHHCIANRDNEHHAQEDQGGYARDVVEKLGHLRVSFTIQMPPRGPRLTIAKLVMAKTPCTTRAVASCECVRNELVAKATYGPCENVWKAYTNATSVRLTALVLGHGHGWVSEFHSRSIGNVNVLLRDDGPDARCSDDTPLLLRVGFLGRLRRLGLGQRREPGVRVRVGLRDINAVASPSVLGKVHRCHVVCVSSVRGSGGVRDKDARGPERVVGPYILSLAAIR